MNVIAYIFNKVSEFSNPTRILQYLVSPGMGEADQFTKGAIVKMFDFVDSLTSDYEKTTITRALEKIALFHVTPVIFIASEGEDFSFEIKKEEGKDFTGFNLRVYNAEDGVALGPAVAGSADDKQEVKVEDLSLTEAHTYRVNVVLETTDPSPDVIALLSEVYLIVDPDIDVS